MADRWDEQAIRLEVPASRRSTARTAAALRAAHAAGVAEERERAAKVAGRQVDATGFDTTGQDGCPNGPHDVCYECINESRAGIAAAIRAGEGH